MRIRTVVSLHTLTIEHNFNNTISNNLPSRKTYWLYPKIFPFAVIILMLVKKQLYKIRVLFFEFLSFEFLSFQSISPC